MKQVTLGTLLRSLVDILDGDVQAFYRSLGLDYKPRFTPVMRVLAEEEQASIRQIQMVTSMSHSAVSQTVTEMVKRGLVELQPGKDARERIATLTPSARDLLPTLQKCWSSTNAAASELSAATNVQLETVLKQVIQELERRPFIDRISDHFGFDPSHFAERPGPAKRSEPLVRSGGLKRVKPVAERRLLRKKQAEPNHDVRQSKR